MTDRLIIDHSLTGEVRLAWMSIIANGDSYSWITALSLCCQSLYAPSGNSVFKSFLSNNSVIIYAEDIKVNSIFRINYDILDIIIIPFRVMMML